MIAEAFRPPGLGYQRYRLYPGALSEPEDSIDYRGGIQSFGQFITGCIEITLRGVQSLLKVGRGRRYLRQRL